MSGGGSKSQTIGYTYYLDMHMGVSRGPVDEVLEVQVADRTAWRGHCKHDDAPITIEGESQQGFMINAPGLFGGEKVEGGIQGSLALLFGKADQVPPNYMKARMGGRVPGFRGTFTAYYSGMISSMNPYPKPWSFRERRNLMGWDGDVFLPDLARIYLRRVAAPVDDHDVIYAQNPAHIIIESLTNRAWGRGLPLAELDVASFTLAAQQLHGEGFGLCIKWTRRDTVQAFVQTILDHIGGVMYLDRATGLLKLALIRGGYNRADLPIVDTDSGLLEIKEVKVAGSAVATNEVIVKYQDHRGNAQKEVRAQNIAAIQAARGQIVSITKEYPAIPTPDLAMRVAQRDLRALGTGLRRFSMTFDRSAWRLAPGQVIRVRDLKRNIPDMVVRLGSIEDGTLANGKITITGLQDVFALPTRTFNSIEPPQWTPADNTPCIGNHRVMEASYRQVFKNNTPADFDYIEPESCFIATLAEEGKPLNAIYDLAVKTGTAGGSDEYAEDPTYVCPLF